MHGCVYAAARAASRLAAVRVLEQCSRVLTFAGRGPQLPSLAYGAPAGQQHPPRNRRKRSNNRSIRLAPALCSRGMSKAGGRGAGAARGGGGASKVRDGAIGPDTESRAAPRALQRTVLRKQCKRPSLSRGPGQHVTWLGELKQFGGVEYSAHFAQGCKGPGVPEARPGQRPGQRPGHRARKEPKPEGRGGPAASLCERVLGKVRGCTSLLHCLVPSGQAMRSCLDPRRACGMEDQQAEKRHSFRHPGVSVSR